MFFRGGVLYGYGLGDFMARELSDEELAVLSRTDKEAMSELLSRYTFVASAKAWAISPEYYEDLFQEGLMGCVAAAKTYDADKGAGFATYANRCIKNRMIKRTKIAASFRFNFLFFRIRLPHILLLPIMNKHY